MWNVEKNNLAAKDHRIARVLTDAAIERGPGLQVLRYRQGILVVERGFLRHQSRTEGLAVHLGAEDVIAGGFGACTDF